MTTSDLPIPWTCGPRRRIDPRDAPESFIAALSELYHAEASALRWFDSMADPRIVEQSELFAGVRRMLLRDEAAHMRDIEEMIRALGGTGVAEPSREARAFWEFAEWGRREALRTRPLRPSTVAFFMFLTEGLGYAFLHQVAHATVEGVVRDRLLSNVKDEEGHIRVSAKLLVRTLDRDRDFFVESLAYAASFLVEARAGLRRVMYDRLQAIGLDYYEVTGASFRFVRDLLLQVLQDAGRLSPRARRFLEAFGDLWCSPLGMRAVRAGLYVPAPPGTWTGLRFAVRVAQRAVRAR
jgi:hypothetical protein